MSKDELKNLAERAAWTFIQAFFATWAVTGMSFNKSSLVAGIAGGFSALKTFAVGLNKK